MSAASGEVNIIYNHASRNVEYNFSRILIGSRIFVFSCLLMQYATHYKILKTKNQENFDYATEAHRALLDYAKPNENWVGTVLRKDAKIA